MKTLAEIMLGEVKLSLFERQVLETILYSEVTSITEIAKVVYRRKTDRPSNLNNGVISAIRQINIKLIKAKSDYEIYTQSHGCKGSTVRFTKKTPPRPKDARAKAGSKRKLK